MKKCKSNNMRNSMRKTRQGKQDFMEHTECKWLPPDHVAMISVRQALCSLVACARLLAAEIPLLPSGAPRKARQDKTRTEYATFREEHGFSQEY